MNNFYTLLALDLAQQRTVEAEQTRRAALARAGIPTRSGFARRGLATGFALVSRGSAAAVRRLDSCMADDLTEALAGAK
jgi:hypothetical protein